MILMIHTGMMGMVVITGDRENDIKAIASVLNEIGVGGLTIEVATDNEKYLVDLVSKGLGKSNVRAFHWRNISEYRPQAKGIERAVGIAKEGIYTNWLAFEQHCQCRIALESPLLGYLIGYVYRTFDMFCDQRQSGTPLEKMRGARGAQKPSSHAFGLIGFVKPVFSWTMEGSEDGALYVSRDEICYWRRVTCISSESRFEWSEGGDPWTLVQIPRRGTV